MDLHGHHIISEITNLCMNFIISSSFLPWPSQNMSNGAKKLKFKISLISTKEDYSMSNLEQSKVQGNLKRQIQHTLDPGLFSSSLVMMVQPLLWAWKGVRCKKPLDNYIIRSGGMPIHGIFLTETCAESWLPRRFLPVVSPWGQCGMRFPLVE